MKRTPSTNPHPIYSPQPPRFITLANPRCVLNSRNCQRRSTSIATVRTRVSTSRVLEEPHEADGVQIIYKPVPGQLLPLYECSVAERRSWHLCLKYEIPPHESMFASVTAETHAPRFCFQLNGEDLPKLHALKLTEATTSQRLKLWDAAA
jgi:hypothetical protein